MDISASMKMDLKWWLKNITNNKADRESRSVNIDTEYELSTDAFQQICSQFGSPTIDLFCNKN
ncbi:hypothetical protein NQ317_008273 [Molorchus minor]|uniref:Uncharacterized protein n=1 Tax=Molorchus minor TaxID=1323400 RepID=A0ABQ9J7Y7_9CUCU|nr:hypothetical protein NQ317_008273 [Molorchus minor]